MQGRRKDFVNHRLPQETSQRENWHAVCSVIGVTNGSSNEAGPIKWSPTKSPGSASPKTFSTKIVEI